MMNYIFNYRMVLFAGLCAISLGCSQPKSVALSYKESHAKPAEGGDSENLESGGDEEPACLRFQKLKDEKAQKTLLALADGEETEEASEESADEETDPCAAEEEVVEEEAVEEETALRGKIKK